jgi:hypothetical protein
LNRIISASLAGTALLVLQAVCPTSSLGAFQTYGFTQITNNGAPAAASQFTVTVFDNASVGLAVGVSPTLLSLGPNEIGFLFRNDGAVASTICDIYFDDGTLVGIASIHNGVGTSFSQGANPGELPNNGSANPDFEVSAGFAADSDPAVQPNGIAPGERMVIVFNLINGQTFANTIAALNTGLSLDPNIDADLQPTNLRIGLHVQGYANGQSESFINGGPIGGSLPVPEPTTMLIWSGISLLSSVGAFRTRRLRG